MTEITDAQVESYKEDGYLVCPNLVRQEELEILKHDIVDIARGKYPCEQIEPLPDEMSDMEVLSRVLCIHQVHILSDIMLDFVKHRCIADVLIRIIGPSVKCMQSIFFVKPSGFQGQAWHQDEYYIPTRDRSLTGGWIAIDDATVENGCLWMIPGSHKPGYIYPMRDHENPEEFDIVPESYGFDASGEIPVEVEAGSVVFFNGYLLHRSKKNRNDRLRRVLVNHFMNAYSLLPWGINEGESVATADRRNVVMVAGDDPYEWKGYSLKESQVYVRTCKANEDLLVKERTK